VGVLIPPQTSGPTLSTPSASPDLLVAGDPQAVASGFYRAQELAPTGIIVAGAGGACVGIGGNDGADLPRDGSCLAGTDGSVVQVFHTVTSSPEVELLNNMVYGTAQYVLIFLKYLQVDCGEICPFTSNILLHV
jgi:hypothetical protein